MVISNSTLKALVDVAFKAPDEIPATAAEVLRAFQLIAQDIVLEDDSETEKLEKLDQIVSRLYCDETGGCNFEHDQCGYWGHDLCYKCNRRQYPELGRLSCSEAKSKVREAISDCKDMDETDQYKYGFMKSMAFNYESRCLMCGGDEH